MPSVVDPGNSHQRIATVYYYVKEPGKTSGRIGVSFLSKELERNTMVIEFTAVDDYVIKI